VFTVAILTSGPNDLTRLVHDRMPVVLKPGGEGAAPTRSCPTPNR